MSFDIRGFHSRLAAAVKELLPAEAGVVCAVSGGPDSMALLHGLQEVNRIYKRRWVLHVAHLDHALRRDSAEDSAFVRQAADLLDLPLTRSRRAVAAARKKGETLEEAARRIRYAFLERTAVAAGANFVATGHHADDQAETVLHHILRGTGLRGLAGMSPVRPIREGSSIALVRPLLGFRRVELTGYLEARGLPSRHDVTNTDAALATRNHLRAEVLPLLEERINPNVVAALGRLAEQARRAAEAIEYYAQQAAKKAELRQGKNAVVLDVRRLAGLSKAVRAEVILLSLRRLGAGLQSVGFERIEAAADAPLQGGKRVIELPGGVIVQRRRGELWIQRGRAASRAHRRGGSKST